MKNWVDLFHTKKYLSMEIFLQNCSNLLALFPIEIILIRKEWKPFRIFGSCKNIISIKNLLNMTDRAYELGQKNGPIY